MDPRNYGMYGQSSPRNVSLHGQSFQGFDRLHRLSGFNKVHVKVLVDARAVEFSRGACQGFQTRMSRISRLHRPVEFSKVHV